MSAAAKPWVLVTGGAGYIGAHTCVALLEAGYPAVRVTEAVENYDRQHQNLRTENGKAYGDTIEGVDFAYLAQVTRLNTVAMASLASAPPPPPSAPAPRPAAPAQTAPGRRWRPGWRGPARAPRCPLR